jgi:hypothetical protein
VTLVVGQQETFHVPGISRIAVSGGVYSVHTVGHDDVVVSGAEPGRSTLLIWKSNGERISAPVRVLPEARHAGVEVPVKTHRHSALRVAADGGVEHGEVLIVEIPEELSDVHEVPTGDGGAQWVGTAPDGTRRVIKVAH